MFLILGMEGAGKTTLLYRLKFGRSWKTMRRDLLDMKEGSQYEEPSVMYHYEDLSMMKSSGVWDIPGSEAMQHMWRMIYHAITIHGIFFVVDASDALDTGRTGPAAKEDPEDDKKDKEARGKRISMARKQIQRLLNEEELRRAPLVVILNFRKPTLEKNDHLLLDELEYKLGLKNLHPSLEKRVMVRRLNCDALKTEDDNKWKEVTYELKQKLNEDWSFESNLN